MFTAKDARSIQHKTFDQQLEDRVREAGDGKSAYVKVWWGHKMEERAKAIAADLKERGFTVTEIRDLDSFRFAEVHFTWEIV